MRFAESSTLHRDENGGTLHGLLRVKHITQDDAHIFCSRRPDRGRDLRLPRLRLVPLRPVRDGGAVRALDPAREEARHRRGVGLHRGRAAVGARAARDRVRASTKATGRSTARRSTCTCPTRSAARGRWGRSSSTPRCPSGSGSRYMGADNQEHFPYVVHRALLGSLERFIGILTEHYAGAFPFWLAPVQIRVLPVGEGHREAARAGGPARALPRRRRRAPTTPSASGSATRSSKSSRSWSSTATRNPTSRWRSASTAGGRHPVASGFPGKACYAEPWQAGAKPSLTS